LDANPAQLAVDDSDVLVIAPSLLTNRTARLYFTGVLGARQIDNGWRCPRRKRTTTELLREIRAFLESKGWKAVASGAAASELMDQEEQRRRSFERTRLAAGGFLQGERSVSWETVQKTLTDFGWNHEKRTLLPHQREGVLHGLAAINAANFSVPGSGKTLTSLALATAHLAAGTIGLVIVVGPLASFRPWEYEVRLALQGSIKASRVRGSASERRAIYARVEDRELLLLSFASAAADQQELIELCKRKRVMLIVDESHRIKRFRGGVWAPALRQIAKPARVRLILSGTPMPNAPTDLFSQLNVLWPTEELTGNADQFQSKVTSDFEDAIRDIRPFMTRTPKSALGLPPYQVHYHTCLLNGVQLEIYELIESGLRRQIQQSETYREKIEALQRGRPIRLMQAATNPYLLNVQDFYLGIPRANYDSSSLMGRLSSYGPTDIPAKTRLALELASEILIAGRKVVVWSTFLSNLDSFATVAQRDLSVTVYQVDGRLATDDIEPGGIKGEGLDETREAVIERFLRDPRPCILAASPAACSESISLHTACTDAIYLDRTFDCARFLQSVDRIHRIGLPPDAQVSVHILSASRETRTTIDDAIDFVLRRKEVRMRALLEQAEISSLGMSQDPITDAEGSEEDLAVLLRFLLGELQ